MPKINITHRGPRSSKFELYSDDESIGIISKGETKGIDVSPGEHTLHAKFVNYSSKKLSYSIFNREIKSYTVYPNRIARLCIPVILLNFCLLAYLLIESKIFGHHHSLLMMLFFFMLIISFIMLHVFKNNYVILKEQR